MKLHPVQPSSVPHSRPARSFLRCAALAVVIACTVVRAQGQSISVPNYSFETPTTTFVSSLINSWQETPQPGWYDPAQNGGYTWAQLVGVFANTASGATDHITNLDGNQAALMFGLPQMGLYQDLSSTFQAGKAYHLTVGVVGQGGGMLDGVTLDLQLYYRTSPTTTVVIGDTTVTENSTNFPDHTTVQNFTLDIPTVQATDAWAGQPIGIEILSTSNFSNAGGYWDLDNVQLNATPAPEPASVALLAFGGLAMLSRRFRCA